MDGARMRCRGSRGWAPAGPRPTLGRTVRAIGRSLGGVPDGARRRGGGERAAAHEEAESELHAGRPCGAPGAGRRSGTGFESKKKRKSPTRRRVARGAAGHPLGDFRARGRAASTPAAGDARRRRRRRLLPPPPSDPTAHAHPRTSARPGRQPRRRRTTSTRRRMANVVVLHGACARVLLAHHGSSRSPSPDPRGAGGGAGAARGGRGHQRRLAAHSSPPVADHAVRHRGVGHDRPRAGRR